MQTSKKFTQRCGIGLPLLDTTRLMHQHGYGKLATGLKKRMSVTIQTFLFQTQFYSTKTELWNLLGVHLHTPLLQWTQSKLEPFLTHSTSCSWCTKHPLSLLWEQWMHLKYLKAMQGIQTMPICMTIVKLNRKVHLAYKWQK